MTTRDIKSGVDAAHSLAPAVRAGTDSAHAGAAVDIRDYDSAMVVFSFGDWTDGTHTPSLQESTTTEGTDFAAVAASDLQGSFTDISDTDGESTVQRVGYAGAKRYLRAVHTVGTATTGLNSAAQILRGNGHSTPLA